MLREKVLRILEDELWDPFDGDCFGQVPRQLDIGYFPHNYQWKDPLELV